MKLMLSAANVDINIQDCVSEYNLLCVRLEHVVPQFKIKDLWCQKPWKGGKFLAAAKAQKGPKNRSPHTIADWSSTPWGLRNVDHRLCSDFDSHYHIKSLMKIRSWKENISKVNCQLSLTSYWDAASENCFYKWYLRRCSNRKACLSHSKTIIVYLGHFCLHLLDMQMIMKGSAQW